MKCVTFFTTACALFGAASAAPLRQDASINIVQRDVDVLGVHVIRDLPPYEPIQYANKDKRDGVNLALRHHDGDEAHPKRDHDDGHVAPKMINRSPQDIPAEVPVKSEGGQIVPYAKRQDIPAEVPVKSENGQIVPYVKRQDIPAEVPVKSENGQIVPYVKRQDIPAEVPVKSENGQIIPYVKRQDIPAEVPVKSENGQIVPY